MLGDGGVSGRGLTLCSLCVPATLLERGRHACYIMLKGPQGEGLEGTVVISKHKLKEDVPESRVLRVGVSPAGETEEEIKDAFDRLRFSKDV